MIAVATGTKLEIARQANGAPWQIENVASGLYGQPSVALESNGITGWGDNADVAIAAQSSGGLVMTSIDSSDVVDFYSEAPGGSTWSQTRITGISFPMDTPAIAAS